MNAVLAQTAPPTDEGLEGVVAARTVLSDVDGARGRLVIRGHTLDEIATHWRYEQVLALLFDGFFGDADLRTLPRALG